MTIGFYLTIFGIGGTAASEWFHFEVVGDPKGYEMVDIFVQKRQLFCWHEIAMSTPNLGALCDGMKEGWK